MRADGVEDVLRLGSLLALRDVELDLLPFLEAAVAATGDRAEVHEHVRATLHRDETVALVAVELLHRALRHLDLPRPGCGAPPQRWGTALPTIALGQPVTRRGGCRPCGRPSVLGGRNNPRSAEERERLARAPGPGASPAPLPPRPRPPEPRRAAPPGTASIRSPSPIDAVADRARSRQRQDPGLRRDADNGGFERERDLGTVAISDRSVTAAPLVPGRIVGTCHDLSRSKIGSGHGQPSRAACLLRSGQNRQGPAPGGTIRTGSTAWYAGTPASATSRSSTASSTRTRTQTGSC